MARLTPKSVDVRCSRQRVQRGLLFLIFMCTAAAGVVTVELEMWLLRPARHMVPDAHRRLMEWGPPPGPIDMAPYLNFTLFWAMVTELREPVLPQRAESANLSALLSPWAENDSNLLDNATESPDYGLDFRAVPLAAVDVLHLAAGTRAAHERQADLAIVVPTAPRMHASYRDPLYPTWWRFKNSCDAEYNRLRTVSVPVDMNGTDALHHTMRLCDTDRACAGFVAPPDKPASLLRFINMNTCELNNPMLSEGTFMPVGSGTYMKSPLQRLPTPISAWLHEKPTQGDLRMVSNYTHVTDSAAFAGLTVRWWSLLSCRTTEQPIGVVDASNGDKIVDKEHQLTYIRHRCLSRPDCAAFSFPSGYMYNAGSVTSASIVCSPQDETSALISRVELPPSAYVVATVESLMQQVLQQDATGVCGNVQRLQRSASVLTALKRQTDAFGKVVQAAVRGPRPRRHNKAVRGNSQVQKRQESYSVTWPDEPPAQEDSWSSEPVVQPFKLPPAVHESVITMPGGVSGLLSGKVLHSSPATRPVGTSYTIDDKYSNLNVIAGAASLDQLLPVNGSAPLDGRARLSVHIYLTEVGALQWSKADVDHPEHARSHLQKEYWNVPFAWLKARYSFSPCISFVSAASYIRLIEREEPAKGRGQPVWHADNKDRIGTRQKVHQSLDYISALRFAAVRSPVAHVSVWEDDSVACPETLAFLSASIAALELVDPYWGGLKVGNGGSGHVFRRDVIIPLLVYIQTRRGSDNIDVSLWRFLQSQGLPEYISLYSRAAHRGTITSLMSELVEVWKPVKCAGLLDHWWGYYAECAFSTKPANATRMDGAQQNYTHVPADERYVDTDLAKFISSGWQCSMFSKGGQLSVDTRPHWMKPK